MKKHYILVSVTKPDAETALEEQVWSSFVSKTEKIGCLDEDTRRYQEGTWLIPRGNGASVLAKIVHQAEVFDLKYEVLYLSSDD